MNYCFDHLSQYIAFLNFCLNVLLLQFCVGCFCVAFPPPTVFDIFGTASQDVDVKYVFSSLIWLASLLFIVHHCALLSCDASQFC